MGADEKNPTSNSNRVSILGVVRQLLLVVLINVPTMSFGMASGWVSVASGESGTGRESDAGTGAVASAVLTFGAAFVGTPMFAALLARSRKVALFATSLSLLACWLLKLVGSVFGGSGWVVGARIAAGLGGAGAWLVAPLLAKEMCNDRVGGAAASALVPAHNLGIVLMYLSADTQMPYRTVLYWCIGVSATHCCALLLVPESPACLSAKGKIKEARKAVAWLRGAKEQCAGVAHAMLELPQKEAKQTPAVTVLKELFSDKYRRRAFLISCIAIVGQETCGVFALLQYAERVFMLARDANSPHVLTAAFINSTESEMTTYPSMQAMNTLTTPARSALVLGIVQLVASLASLYLVEKIGRRPLLVSTAFATSACLTWAAAAVWPSGSALVSESSGAGENVTVNSALWALSGAVALDSLGLQPVPYAVMTDMFHYQYRGCALTLATIAASAGGGIESALFPAVATTGIHSAFALAAVLTGIYAVFAILTVPETNNKTVQQIYDEWIDKKKPSNNNNNIERERTADEKFSDGTVFTIM